MEQNLQHTVALLTQTPAALDALLRDLPEAWTQSNEGKDTWSAYDVVAHLIHCEDDDWTARIRLILRSGDTQAFTPFEREGHVRYSQGKTLAELLDEFARRRAQNLAEVDAMKLTPEDLARRGRHPSFGPVTLSQLLASWAAHDMTHLHQISRIIAHQYREAVGPWAQYMGVMKCGAHSSAA